MEKKTLLHIGIISVIAILIIFLIVKLVQNSNNSKLDKTLEQKIIIENKIDSIKIINYQIDSLNKKDGTKLENTKNNLSKIDTIVNNAGIYELAKLLQGHTN